MIGGPPLNMWGAKKNYKVIAWAKDYTNLPQNAVIVTDKKIQQSPDQAKRMIKGTIEALRFIQTNKKEVDRNSCRLFEVGSGNRHWHVRKLFSGLQP